MEYGRVLAGANIRRGFVDTSLGQLHYRTSGEGPALVLLHNTWLSSKMFTGIIPALAEHFRVLAIDTLGQGDSDPAPARQLEIADYANVLLEALTNLGAETFAVAGNHTGAVIAAEMSIIAPQRVRRLVLAGIPFWRTPANRVNNETQPMFADWEEQPDGSHLVDLWEKHGGRGRYSFGSASEVFLDYLKPGPRTSIALRALFRWDSNNRLPLITVPTLIVSAEDDFFTKRIRDVHALIPNSRLEIFPGGKPHPLYDPEWFAQAVTDFCLP